MEIDDVLLNKINNYIIFAFLNYCIYTDDIKIILNENNDFSEDTSILYSDVFLYSLENFVIENKKLHILSKNAKSNIFEILYFIRKNKKFKSKYDRDKYIDIYNDIIININRAPAEDNYEQYVCDELSSRIHNPKSLKRFWKEPNKEVFNESYFYDIKILNGLLKDSKEFEDFANEMVGNEYYFLSVRKILYELPEIFKNEEITSRIRYILNLNRKYKSLYFVAPYTMYKNRNTDKEIKKLTKKI